VGQDLRHRGVAAEPAEVSRDLVLQQYRGVPGAARKHQGSAGRNGEGRVRAHAQRSGPRGGPDAARHSRKLPGGRRLGDDSGRAGANAAATLRTAAALDVGGLAVPNGSYSLYVWVKDPNAWELIVNKETGQSGLDYNAKLDLGRVKMTMSKPPALVEKLKYTL